MQKTRKLVADALRAIIFFIVMLITLFYLLVLSMTIGLMHLDNFFKELAVLPFYAITAGYGLFSFWWLLRKFETLSISEIPNSITLGLVSGSAISIAYFVSAKDKYLNGMPGLIFLDLSIILMLTFLLILLLFIIVWPVKSPNKP